MKHAAIICAALVLVGCNTVDTNTVASCLLLDCQPSRAEQEQQNAKAQAAAAAAQAEAKRSAEQEFAACERDGYNRTQCYEILSRIHAQAYQQQQQSRPRTCDVMPGLEDGMPGAVFCD